MPISLENKVMKISRITTSVSFDSAALLKK